MYTCTPATCSSITDESKRKFLGPANLPPRWLLKNHPLYDEAVAILTGIDVHADIDIAEDSFGKDVVSFGYATLEEIHDAPNTRNATVRYQKMKELLLPLCERVKVSEIAFKALYANMVKMVSPLSDLNQIPSDDRDLFKKI